MKLLRKIKLLAIPAIIINLMLTGMATAQANSPRRYELTSMMGNACTNSVYEAGELFAKCGIPHTGEYRQTSIDLNKYIANHEGVLVWSKEGNFADTSSDCRISPPGYSSSTLACYARTIDSRDVFTSLDLGEHIAYVDG